jgi:hypothetical protein
LTQARTAGIWATRDTLRVTSGERISALASAPAIIGKKDVLDGASVIPETWLITNASSQRSAFGSIRIAAAVAARYNAPESTCRNPICSATHCAVDDFPEAAGPSMAITNRADVNA